jgi:hypothetical protein
MHSNVGGLADEAGTDNRDVEVNMTNWINALADLQTRANPACW